MNASTITSHEIFVGLSTDLLELGFDEIGGRVPSQSDSQTIAYSQAGFAVSVYLTRETVSKPGVDDVWSSTIFELAEDGYQTGVSHKTSHLNVRNARAVVALVAALLEAGI